MPASQASQKMEERLLIKVQLKYDPVLSPSFLHPGWWSVRRRLGDYLVTLPNHREWEVGSEVQFSAHVQGPGIFIAESIEILVGNPDDY